jgi:hypothetical protein
MKITITKQDFKKFYINHYFNDQSKLIGFLRRYLGPIMIVGAIYMYWEFEEQINIILLGIMMAFGAFYTIKPFILINITKMQDETFAISFKDNNLHIKDRLKEGDIDLKRNQLHENTQYFYVKIATGQTLFFPKHMLNEKIREEFRSFL